MMQMLRRLWVKRLAVGLAAALAAVGSAPRILIDGE